MIKYSESGTSRFQHAGGEQDTFDGIGGNAGKEHLFSGRQPEDGLFYGSTTRLSFQNDQKLPDAYNFYPFVFLVGEMADIFCNQIIGMTGYGAG